MKAKNKVNGGRVKKKIINAKETRENKSKRRKNGDEDMMDEK